MGSHIKSPRTLSKKLKKLESEGYITWEKKRHEGRGHTSKISSTPKTHKMIDIENKFNNFLEKYYRENTNEKIKVEAHNIISKRLGSDGTIKKMQILDDLDRLRTAQHGIIDIASSSIYAKLPYIFELSKKEIDQLKLKASKERPRIDFKEYCRKKLLA